MAAAGAALLRSANKMAPRIASALERRGRLPTSSRFSTSSGSTPPPPNPRGSRPGNTNILSDKERDRAKTAAIEATTTCVFFTFVGGIFVTYSWVNRKLSSKDL